MSDYQNGRLEGLLFNGDDTEYLRNRSLEFIKGFQETYGWQLWY